MVASATPNFDQLVVVAMENKNLDEVYQNGNAPYENSLNQGAATHWRSLVNPSQVNYIGLIGGDTFGLGGDGNHPNLPYTTLIDILSATGKTWRAFAEDASGTGCSIHPPRSEDHYPFLSFTTITGNATRCANLLPGSGAQVIDALKSGVNFIWLTPNDCNNMHSCSVSTGDSWLQSWVPDLLVAMAGKKAALMLWWDEAYTSPPYIPLFIAGTAAKDAYVSSSEYTHYSLLKLVEDVWGGGDLGRNDVTAPSPLEFFLPGGPDFSISANPKRVTFPSGGSASTTVTVAATGGFAGTVDLTTSSAPSGVTTTCSPSRITGGNGTSTCTMTGSNVGAYTVTITGTNGSLAHGTPVLVTIAKPGPTARFTFNPAFPTVGQSVGFDASSSTDADPGATLEARWDWEGDGAWDTGYSATLIAQHAFAAAGSYPVKLEVRDSHGLVDAVSHAVPVLVEGVGDVGAPPGYGLADPTRLEARGPINIIGNAAFNAANGVRGGTGTAGDPYVISDWFIDARNYTGAQAMIHIENTDAYVIIENNRIVNLVDSNHWEGIQLGHWPAIISTSHVTILHNEILNARHAYGIAVREGSSDVYVGANYVTLDANYQDVYGIATDRNVHDVTITGNYVNAYTSGTFRTAGIHISDTHIDDSRRATNVVAVRNTVANATAGGIVSLSSTDTRIEANRVFMDYPGPKSVGPDYPRGIITEQSSLGTLVARNQIQTFHWGIEVGADRGTLVSNVIANVDYAVYVVDNGTFPGATSYGETIYNTSYSGAATGGIRLPAGFRGNVVDLGPEIRPSDTTAGTLALAGTVTQISYSWSGRLVNLSAAVDGAILFDTLMASESQNLLATWSGSIVNLDVTSFEVGRVAFQLEASGSVSFSGSGFAPGQTYNLNRTDGGGTTTVLSASSSPTGEIAFTIPATAAPAAFGLEAEAAADPLAPRSAPSVVGTAGTNGWYVSAVNVTLTATSPSGSSVSIVYRLDGGPWSAYSGPIVVTAGDHMLEWQASDDAGHREAIRSMPVRIDLTDPSVTDLAPSGNVTDPHATVSWKGSDDLSGIARFEVRVDGGSFQSVGTATTYSEAWAPGPHTVQVKAIDNAGREGSASTSFTIERTASVSGGLFEVLPLSFPAMALALLAGSFAVVRRRRKTGSSNPWAPTKRAKVSPPRAPPRAAESVKRPSRSLAEERRVQSDDLSPEELASRDGTSP